MSSRTTKDSNIKKVGLFGDITIENKKLVRDTVFELKKLFGTENLVISTLWSKQGADKLVKKYSLEMGVTFKEFNPVYTPYTLYSAMPEYSYNQVWHPARDRMHLKPFISNNQSFIVFISKNNSTEKFTSTLDYLIKQFTKKQKQYVLIQDII